MVNFSADLNETNPCSSSERTTEMDSSPKSKSVNACPNQPTISDPSKATELPPNTSSNQSINSQKSIHVIAKQISDNILKYSTADGGFIGPTKNPVKSTAPHSTKGLVNDPIFEHGKGKSTDEGTSNPNPVQIPPDPQVSDVPFSSIDFSGTTPTAIFSKEECETVADYYKFALIGKFTYGKPTNQVISQQLKSEGFGICKVQFLNGKHVLINLTCKSLCDKLWLKREHNFTGFPMRLFKWSPTFDFRNESAVVPVWFKIHGLPSQWFDLRPLKTSARLVGNFVKVDDYTLNRSKMSFARLCVSINLEVDLTTKINMSADDVITEYDIEYEKYQNTVNTVGTLDTTSFLPDYTDTFITVGNSKNFRKTGSPNKNPGNQPFKLHTNTFDILSSGQDLEDPNSSSHEEIGSINVNINQDIDNLNKVTDLTTNSNPNEPISLDNGDLDLDTEGGGTMTIFVPKEDNLNGIKNDANLFDVQVGFAGEQIRSENLESPDGETDACGILSESNDDFDFDTGGGSDRSSNFTNSPLKQSSSDTNGECEDLIDKNFFKRTGKHKLSKIKNKNLTTDVPKRNTRSSSRQ
ncbi:hypothetical protein OROHE_006913 [Orobanche hederae]